MPARSYSALLTGLVVTASSLVTVSGSSETARGALTATGNPAAVTAAAAAPAAADVTLSRRLSGAASSRYLGSYLTGLVIDLGSGATVWAHNAAQVRLPASTQKVLTAFTALSSMSPAKRLVTTVQQSTAAPDHIYLRGSGDPSLSAARLDALAGRTAAALKAQKRISVRLYADASAFPAPTSAIGWKASYVPGEVQPVRGLTLAGYGGTDNDLAAVAALRTALAANGITVVKSGRATTPAASRQLAASVSEPVSAMIATTLRVSDNTYAEYLLRLSARARGLAPTWAQALENQRSILTAAGIPTTGLISADGSGLSRINRMPAQTLAATVRALYTDPAKKAVAFAPGAMPIAGQTGTLRTRFATAAQRCARGSVQAKTGTLDDVISLAGTATDVSGRTRAFVLMENGRTDSAQVRAALDQAATVLTGCR